MERLEGAFSRWVLQKRIKVGGEQGGCEESGEESRKGSRCGKSGEESREESRCEESGEESRCAESGEESREESGEEGSKEGGETSRQTSRDLAVASCSLTRNTHNDSRNKSRDRAYGSWTVCDGGSISHGMWETRVLAREIGGGRRLEVDFFCLNGSGRAPRSSLILPIQVGVRDDLGGRRCSPR